MSAQLPVPGLDRDQLVGLAFRMLGTLADAEDAVQESFIRWYRLNEQQRNEVTNPVGWFAKTTSRICLDVLKSASRRRELYVGPWLPESVPVARFVKSGAENQDPAEHALEAETLSMALLTLMENMSPAERVAFVLKDVFNYPVSDIAEVLDKSPGAVRQLASVARSKVANKPSASAPESSKLLIAFQRAAATGNISDLINILHPDVTLRSDGGGIVRAALNPIHGAEKVARFIIGVLERQATTSFDITQGPSGEVATFTRGHTTRGVLELVTTEDDRRATEVLIQWNPKKLQAWNQG
ncbi:sigma-70 family RNA polymerase sigma factor [Corynebacterium glutamicum]|uniref:sigma-70 family RNA polymerase sigma factor n=1 Tax=Corynebacterium glutamicum TaxID=1718 RepID=UPI000744D645|nr:sigma-70 family RNA polymerase sigma factor [Corynebacterium glutamicum]ALZ98814.1 hypothetical protein APT58_00340 [Corynebacterium glutamicum]